MQPRQRIPGRRQGPLGQGGRPARARGGQSGGDGTAQLVYKARYDDAWTPSRVPRDHRLERGRVIASARRCQRAEPKPNAVRLRDDPGHDRRLVGGHRTPHAGCTPTTVLGSPGTTKGTGRTGLVGIISLQIQGRPHDQQANCCPGTRLVRTRSATSSLVNAPRRSPVPALAAS
jgi:hypothetical protein